MKKIVVLEGDGVGPEICGPAVKVLGRVAARFGMPISIQKMPVGGASIDLEGTPLTEETLEKAKQSDAVLLGAVGGPKWENLDFEHRPERGLLKIRKVLQLFSNLRPANLLLKKADASPLKFDVVKGVDLIVVRELTGGIYFGNPRGVFEDNGVRQGINTLRYNENEISRIAGLAFETARQRKGKLCSVDKANVLETTELWRQVFTEIGADYPDVELSHMYVDNAAMQLVAKPTRFDVIATSNMFGDILSDLAAVITGSIGLLPSASLGNGTGLFEPVHGSAPDIAGQDRANPVAAILSVGMMFKYAFKMPSAESLIERAVAKTLESFRTFDIPSPGTRQVGCAEMGDRICDTLQSF